MKCEEYRALLPEYWEGGLEENERVAFEMHLASCVGCRSEADSLASIWHGLSRIPMAQPSTDLRRRFYERLDAFQQGALEQSGSKPTSLGERLRAWFTLRPAFQIGFSVAMLALGFLAGYGVDHKKEETQVSQLRAEVGSMRQLVTLSLLQQQNASERLKGVNFASRVEQSDTEVLSALLRTVNHDANVNVRLAAVDALQTFAASPVARRGLIQSIGKQESPLVQVALIDAIAEMQDPQAIPVLSKLAADPNANSSVIQSARSALARLQQ